MKNILLLSFVFVSFTAFSQSIAYQPFPEGKADWLMKSYGTPWWAGDFDYLYYTHTDTIIKGKNYNKVLVSDLGTPIYSYPPTPPYDLITTYSKKSIPGSYAFSYRNDIPNKKVYIVYKDSVNERLWFDFNYGVGDTLKANADAYYKLHGYPSIDSDYNTHQFKNTFPLIVKSIDSVKYCGKFHKRFHFKSCDPHTTPFSMQLIEGIGFSYFFIGDRGHCYVLEPPRTYSTDFSTEDGCTKTFYQNLTTSVQTVLEVEQINIFPNPANNNIQLFINVAEHQKMNYIITNNLGEPLLKDEISTSKTLDISTLSPGIYYLQVFSDGKVYSTNKIVKQ